MPDEWVMRLCALVKRYAPSEQGASFRNEYKDVLDAAHGEGAITKEDADLLLKARSSLEAWVSGKPDQSTDANNQWKELYEAGKDRLPAEILEAFLGRFPKSAAGKLDWGPLALRSSEKNLLKVLVARHLIRTVDLVRIAKASPSEFYRSAALDLLVERKRTCPRPVWDGFSRGESRPANLLQAPEALVLSFAADSKADAVKWFVRFVADSPGVRESILASLLRNPQAAFRLAGYISPVSMSRAKSRKKPTDVPAVIIVAWVEASERALGEGGDSAATASVVLGLLQLSALADPKRFPSDALAALSSITGRIAERTIRLALQSGEADGARSARKLAVVARGDELYRAVQEYLRRLPVGALGESESPERVLRFERYMGRREVILGLL